jgi:hypothetical protein
MADEPTMKEKLDTLKNDAKVRSTYFSQAVADASSAGGRFSSITGAHVVGSAPAQQWPEMPEGNPWACDPVPKEEPLGYSINDMELVRQPFEIEQSKNSLEKAGTPTSGDGPTPLFADGGRRPSTFRRRV